jgi:uncharacterized protein with ParB-like and HNH nuclease domain
MKVQKISLSELFSNRKRYVVPLFQRAYVWTRDRQWQPLWLDVVERAEAVLHPPNGGRTQEHFLGAIVTAPRTAFGVGVPVAELIDGQQRLTTLQILLHALHDVAKEDGETIIAEAVGTLLRNQRPWASEDDQYKVWPTNDDQVVYQSIVEAGSYDAVLKAYPERKLKYKRSPEPRALLADAYLHFYSSIEKFTEEDRNLRFAALYQAVAQQLQVVHIELEADEDPQAIFEALNGRGEPLTPADLIKNYLFRKVPAAEQQAIYEQYWRPIDTRNAEDNAESEGKFWRRRQRQGRLTRSRLDVFFFHYLAMRKNGETTIGSLFREFQTWHDGSNEGILTTLASVQRHANEFARLLAPVGSDRLDTFARRVRALDISTVYPPVLFLLGEGAERVESGALSPILENIESYLVRRAVCRVSTKAYNHLFLQLLDELRSAERIDAALVRTFLAELKGEHHEWPGDGGFRTAWLSKAAYRDMGAQRTAMILRALNDAEFSRFHEVVEIKSPLTVDHVLPQAWRAKWPPPLVPGLTPDLAAGRRDELLHTFGNLTLITGELNSKLKNAGFKERREDLAKRSVLRLNSWFQESTEWNEEEIARRGEALFETALQVWPGPG